MGTFQVGSVETITTADANIFSEYLLPNLKKFSSDSEGFVRATYAASVPGFGKCGMTLRLNDALIC